MAEVHQPPRPTNTNQVIDALNRLVPPDAIRLIDDETVEIIPDVSLEMPTTSYEDAITVMDFLKQTRVHNTGQKLLYRGWYFYMSTSRDLAIEKAPQNTTSADNGVANTWSHQLKSTD